MGLLFPDNTVMCNFAAVRRLDVLRDVLDGRGRWCEAVSHEAGKSAHHLPDLAIIPKEGWLGEPIEIDDPEMIRRIDVIRRQNLGGKAKIPTQHLGEAQTCFVITEQPAYRGSTWVSDDQDSLDHARFRQIPTMETIDLVSEAVLANLLTRAAGFQLMEQMRALDRVVRMPDGPGDL